jgi:hypothetical protein
VVTTGSVLILDLEAKRIERVTGVNPPTPRQGRDGTPKPYEGLWVLDTMGQRKVDTPLPGLELHVQWADTSATRCSTVVAVTDRPAWGRSFWLVDPDQLGTIGGAVMAAGRPCLTTLTMEAALVTAALLTIGCSDAPTATAMGVAAASYLDASQWAAVDNEPVLAGVSEDGWRRPWATPPTTSPLQPG